jgi:hypothetical protein
LQYENPQPQKKDPNVVVAKYTPPGKGKSPAKNKKRQQTPVAKRGETPGKSGKKSNKNKGKDVGDGNVVTRFLTPTVIICGIVGFSLLGVGLLVGPRFLKK